MRLKAMKIPIVAALLMTILILSSGTATTSAKPPAIKMVDTVVGSYSIDGTTVYYVSHITGIMKWIKEPTAYEEWQGTQIPVDGKLRVVSSSLQHEKVFWYDNRVSISHVSDKYVGTLEIIPTSSESPFMLPPYMAAPKDGQMKVQYFVKNFGEQGIYKYQAVIKYENFVPRVLMEKLMLPHQPDPGQATFLTGDIRDYGLDSNEDGTYDNLVVSVGVEVKTPGMYTVNIDSLFDSSRNYIEISNTVNEYLTSGTQFVDVPLYGPTIYAHGLDPSMVGAIFLLDDNFNWLGVVTDVPLSEEYFFDDFDIPPVILTGVIYDKGVDTDDVEGFDYLEIGIEVEVSVSGFYSVELYGLLDANDNIIYDAWGREYQHLEAETQIVYLRLNGPSIYASGLNASDVNMIRLRNDQSYIIGLAYGFQLSRTYDYTEFEAPGAYLTGSITCYALDIDDPPNGLFDYLVIGVEVMVFQLGIYFVEVSGLADEYGNMIMVASTGFTSDTETGSQFVILLFEGQLISRQGLSPSGIFSIRLYDSEYNFLGQVSDIPLPMVYYYEQFESEF